MSTCLDWFLLKYQDTDREVATFLNRKFGGVISSIETVAKEDLDLVRLKKYYQNIPVIFQSAGLLIWFLGTNWAQYIFDFLLVILTFWLLEQSLGWTEKKLHQVIISNCERLDES